MTFVLDPAITALGSGLLVNTILANGEPLQIETLKEVTIDSQDYAHEQAIISVTLTTPQVNSLQDSTIKFTYGPRLALSTFYGYISEIAPSRNYQENMMYDLTCTGATRPLQEYGKPRFYTKKTITAIVADLITQRHLGVQVEQSDFQFASLAQTSQSDWEFILAVAKLAGFSVYNYQGVVRIVNPMRILNESGPSIRLIKGDEVLDKSRVLLDFQPIAYSTKKPKHTQPAFGYFNNGNPQVTHVPDENYNFHSDTPILDKSMADFFVKAWDSNSDYWVQKATARIQGNTSIHPGVMVSVQISGSSVIQHDYDGLWLVQGTRHSITAGSFQTSLVMARDNKKRLANTDTKPWTQTAQGHPQMSQKSVEDDWQSSWKTPEYISANIKSSPSKTPSNPVWTSY